ncbi:hypothetical protein [Brevibacillus porteri]|uniref:hypothetical protein n=1 Tax=Brevibacillus porteri TaxID=2126350 RepID=UPI00362E3DBE
MSADNGVYILKTRDQYRVAYAHAIENLWWNYAKRISEKEMVSTRLAELYGSKRYTKDAEKAMKVAQDIARDSGYLEYGIRILSINKTWKQIAYEAKRLAPLEIAAIKERYNEKLWKYEVERLEQIIAN